MQRTFILFGTILLLFLFGITNISNAAIKPSDYKIGMPYYSAVNSKKPAVVLFYADWCGTCQRFMPIFNNVYFINNKNYNFAMVNIDKNLLLSSQYGVREIPKVFIIDKVNNQKIEIPIKYYPNISKLNGILDEYLQRRK